MAITYGRRSKKKYIAMGTFDELPEELLDSILENLWRPRKNIILDAMLDFIRASAVCKTWRRASSRVNKQLGVVGPLIFVPPLSRKRARLSSLHDFSTNITQQIRLPITRDRRFINSWNEWLITVENRSVNNNLVDSDYQIYFFNMFSGAYIQLPPSSALHHPHWGLLWMIYKAIASCTPLDLNCVIMSIRSDRFTLAYCKIGGKKWMILKTKSNLDCYADLIYYKDEFYVVTERGNLFLCNLNCVKPKIVSCMDLVYQERAHNYLVEVSGDLFRIVRQFHLKDGVRLFTVYKMDFSKHQWQAVDSFGGENSVFIGENKSIFISAKDLSIQRDCIYFNDNYNKAKILDIDNNVGVFHLKTKLAETSFSALRSSSSRLFWITKA